LGGFTEAFKVYTVLTWRRSSLNNLEALCSNVDEILRLQLSFISFSSKFLFVWYLHRKKLRPVITI